MFKLNVDCCSVTAQDNEPRVTFTTRKFPSTQEEEPVEETIPPFPDEQSVVEEDDSVSEDDQAY